MKKIFALLCAACMLTASLSACSNDSDSMTVEEGKLLMATNATFPPYEYYEDGEIVGIDVEIAEKIAEKLDLELEIQDMEFNSITDSVSSGKSDMGMAGMTVSEDRLKNVDFSDSYAKGVQVVIVKEDSDIKTIDDLSGKKIGVQLNTTGDSYATEDFGKDNVQQFNKATDTVLALTQDKVDAVIIDKAPAEVFVQQNEGLTLLSSSYADEDYAICFKKGNTELQKEVNDALNELIEDGTVQAIIDKYIPAE